MSVTRIAISLDSVLLAKLDSRMAKAFYKNRSKAISSILQDWFLKEESESGNGGVGTISIVYNHHTPGVLERVTEVQHHFGANVVASMHVHLSHDDCLEVITTRGGVQQLRKIADSISCVRGVKACKLSVIA